METEQVDCDVTTLQGWTKEEKFSLLQGIKAFGSADIEHIQESVTSKSADEILTAVAYYKRKAQNHPVFNKKYIENIRESKPRIPLASWAKLLTDSFSFEELCTETSTALRMIADLEDIPPATSTEGINFRTVYHEIANAMEGKSLGQDKVICALMNKCLVETALSSKTFIRSNSFRQLITSVNLSDQETNVFPRPTENHELGVLRHLASQKKYNPLNIPEDSLKPICDTNWEECLEEIARSGPLNANTSNTT